MKFTSLAFFLLLLLAIGGCTSKYAPPTAQVISIALAEQSPQGVRVQVTVELKNDNAVPMPLVESKYRVTLEGIGTFTFADKLHKAIPARRTDINAGPASQIITLLAAFATEGRDVKGVACQVTGIVVYEPPGEIRKIMTETAIPLPSVSFMGEAKLE